MMLEQISKEDAIGEVEKQWLWIERFRCKFQFCHWFAVWLWAGTIPFWACFITSNLEEKRQDALWTPFQHQLWLGSQASPCCPWTLPPAFPLCLQSLGGGERVSPSYVIFPFKLRFTVTCPHFSGSDSWCIMSSWDALSRSDQGNQGKDNLQIALGWRCCYRMMLILLLTEISPVWVEAFWCLKPDGISCLDQPQSFGSHDNPKVPPTATFPFSELLPLPPLCQGPWRIKPLTSMCMALYSLQHTPAFSTSFTPHHSLAR